nr:hypothetical protein [uncultured Agathobaculum sp.]
MTDTVSKDILHQLFQEYPEIFIAFLECERFASYVPSVAFELRRCCSPSEYAAFQNMVLAYGGSLEEEPPRRSDAFSLTMRIE